MSLAATRISFSYPKKMKDQLLILARRDNRSLSSFVQVLLREGIEKYGIIEKEEEYQKPEVRITPHKKIRKRIVR